jgi:hypothetical protein
MEMPKSGLSNNENVHLTPFIYVSFEIFFLAGSWLWITAVYRNGKIADAILQEMKSERRLRQ